MLHIGCHLSIAKGYEAMGREALKIEADTFQFFTRNPRGGAAKEINPHDARALSVLMDKYNFAPLLAHASYTLNLSSSKPETRKYAVEMMADDLSRLEKLPCRLYNFHPGSHSGYRLEQAVEYIADGLNSVIHPDQEVIILLETMSGKGSEVGGTFEQLREILDRVELKEKMGVCIDTCHVFDAGYDIVNNLDGVLTQFDKVIGLKRLHAVHLNDSMNALGSRKDRHAKIGEGNIGLEAFGRIINHPELRHLPFLLETPNELEGYAAEIKTLKGLYR